jgi:hypothetical protein
MIFSAGLHVAVIVLAILGLPALFARVPTTDPPIIVEMVRISDKTRTLPTPPKPKPAAKRPVKSKPERVRPKTAAVPPPPPPDLAELEPLPVPKPKPKVKPKPKPKPKVKPKPKPKPKVKIKKPPPKPKIKKRKRRKPRLAKIKPRRKPLAPREDFIDSVLKDVSKEKPREKAKKPEKKVVQKAEPAPPRPRPSLDERLTISELDAIRRQIEACWNIPAGARDAENLIVDIKVVMNPDGTVQRAEIVDRSRLTGDPFYRAAAESALRAVLHPRCSPLRLPPQKFQQWRRFTLSFNPKELIGS